MGWLGNTVFVLFGVRRFTKAGYQAAAKRFDNTVMSRDLRGRICIVTGANAGLGLQLSKDLAQRGCTLYMLCRNEERGRAAVEGVQQASGNKDVHLKICDVSSLDSIRAFALELDAKKERVFLLVNNAGVMVHDRTLSADGHEVNFATNTLGTFLLTRLLEPALECGCPGSKVIFVTSGGAYTEKLVVDDMQFERGKFDGTVQYARDKRRQIALTEQFSLRLAAKEIGVYCMHPGWADTEGVRTSIPGFHKAMKDRLRTPAEGIDTAVWLALEDNGKLEGGALYLDRKPQHKHLSLAGTVYSQAESDLLWHRLEVMTGLAAPEPEGSEEAVQAAAAAVGDLAITDQPATQQSATAEGPSAASAEPAVATAAAEQAAVVGAAEVSAEAADTAAKDEESADQGVGGADADTPEAAQGRLVA